MEDENEKMGGGASSKEKRRIFNGNGSENGKYVRGIVNKDVCLCTPLLLVATVFIALDIIIIVNDHHRAPCLAPEKGAAK